MLTRTLPSPETVSLNLKEQAEKSVEEKGFALYEWISPEELSLTVKRDYLKIVRWASIPLAIISAIAGFIWFAAGPIGTIIAVLGVLGVFYGTVFCILFVKLLRRAYGYTRMADIVMTDEHYIVGKNIFKNTETAEIRDAFAYFEQTFEEPFMWVSTLPDTIEHEKTNLFENLKNIAMWWWKVLQGVWRSRNWGWLVVALVLAWMLYGAMMALVYSIGIFFISIFGRIFSWIAYRFLLLTNNTEHRIQDLFRNIDNTANSLETEKSATIDLLDEAARNNWQENLFGKINESTELLAKLAWSATKDSTKLKWILESSKYKDIFNFIKYGNWVKKQILEPIESILSLLEKNHTKIGKTIIELDTQIAETPDPSLHGPLESQKTRLEIQKESFERVIDMLQGYKEKLQ